MRVFLLFALAALSSSVVAQQKPPAADALSLSSSERALVAGSREAIIETGVTPAFFDAHFRVARVVDGPGDRRVVWLLSVGAYEATVNDSVGYYTEGARRVDTHSVAATLSKTSDIGRTITRRRAELLMRRCIGRFKDARVEYRAHGAEGRAALLLTAHSLVPRRREARRHQPRERPESTRATDEAGTEDEGGEEPVFVLGAVNLVTGECTFGYGRSGPLPPQPARRSRRRR